MALIVMVKYNNNINNNVISKNNINNNNKGNINFTGITNIYCNINK